MRKLLNTIKEYKTFIVPWVALIGVIVVLASGLTYAYFDFVTDSESESSMKITATNLNVDLSISSVNLNNMVPIYDEYKDTKANTFTFTMSNTSRKLSGCVDLYLGINSMSKKLANADFKWELTNNTTSTTTRGTFATVSDNRLLIKENENIPISTTYSYTLKIWYSYRDDVDQSFVSGASLNSKLMSVAYGGTCGAQNSTSYTTVGTTEFTASEDGYYRIETYNINGDYASGEILLQDNEKLYFSVSNTSGTPTSIKCYADSKGICGTQGSQNENNSRIMYAKTDLASSFMSGYAGVNSPSYVTSSNELSNNTIHPTGKFFLNGKMEFGTNSKTPKVVVTYLGKYMERNTKLDNVRYVKDCVNGSTSNTSNHWVEIQAIKNGVNIAYNKTVTGTSASINNTTKSYSYIVDGRLDNVTGSSGYAESTSLGNQCVTIDLGRAYDLDEVAVWHYYADGRKYHDNITSVSSNNTNWTEIRSETKTGETPETVNGKRVSAYKTTLKQPPIYIKGTSNPREVKIGTEEFYVLNDIIDYSALDSTFLTKINYDSNKIILLAKYSLYVGRNCTSSSSCTLISTSASGYGLQSADAKGYTGTYPSVAVVPFSGSSNSYGYWYDSANSTIYSKYGTSYNASNIYDTNYITAPNYSVAFSSNVGNANYSIAYYVEEYVDRLGIEGEGRLLTYTEVNAMTKAQRTNGARFWLGSASYGSSVWSVGTSGDLNGSGFNGTGYGGVRPIIVMDANDIKMPFTRYGADSTTGLSVVKVTGTNEEFYDLTNVINYTNLINTNGNIYNYSSDKSILLAKYNLYVGQNCTSSGSCTPISTSTSGYGLQSVDAKGYVSSSSMIAAVPFSGSTTSNGYWYDTSTSTIKTQYGTSYNASNIYDTTYKTSPNYSVALSNNAVNGNYSIAYYVEEYVDRLGIEGTGRLLTYTEANAMTQVQRNNGAYYWLGSANSNLIVWYVNYPGALYGYTFYSKHYNGVRPVIVVNTADIE